MPKATPTLTREQCNYAITPLKDKQKALECVQTFIQRARIPSMPLKNVVAPLRVKDESVQHCIASIMTDLSAQMGREVSECTSLIIECKNGITD